jgi:mono/diheme cytochrome c family protein
MKSFQLVLIALVVALASAFSPSTKPMSSIKSVSVVQQQHPEKVATMEQKNAAAMAAFATALAPFAANAADVDEATIIGYGAGLVACVVSLAVGFAIGYGTLVKP